MFVRLQINHYEVVYSYWLGLSKGIYLHRIIIQATQSYSNDSLQLHEVLYLC